MIVRGAVAPSQRLRALIAQGAIGAASPISESQIQPASLDVRLGRRAWRIRASFLPGGAPVMERLADFAMHEMDLGAGAVFETGCVYLCEIEERLRLPTLWAAAANAKSSSGRLDLFIRMIVDGGREFDMAPAGYEGPIYAEISPRSFSVLARAGVTLSQLRLRAAEGPEPETAALLRAAGVEADSEGGLPFSVDLRPGAGRVAGWRARRHAGLIDLGRVAAYDPADYWEALTADPAGRIILDPGAFYILASREAVRIPPGFAAEMAPYSAAAGEFRVHYAGFFDPGFGWAAAGGEGSRGVLEVRCHETPFALEHGQTMGRLIYEPMAEAPDKLYGAGGIGSHYQRQGLKLSKHFR